MAKFTKLLIGILASVLAVASSAVAHDARVPAEKADLQSGCPVVESWNWKAWVDRMPGLEPKPEERLNVKGEVKLPTSGYQVELKRMDPSTYRLHLIITPPTGLVAQVPTTYEVKDIFSVTAPTNKSVIIYCGDQMLTKIKIRIILVHNG